MEKLTMTLNEKVKKELKNSYNEALKNENFKNLVNNLKISEELGCKNTSQIMDAVEELKNCKNCKGLYMCKNKFEGHVYFPEVNNNTLKFNYVACKYQKKLEKMQEEKEKSVNAIAYAKIKDIYTDDKKRLPIIKWLKNFYDHYEKVNTLKGLYLHGSFGSGKTFMLAAFLNELVEKKNANVEIVYWPEALRNMKEDFSLVEEKLAYYQNVDILVVDDIGAENVTAWGRDEILGTILQSRMNKKLTTFFTSNYNIQELEAHLAITKNSEDVVKAQRIIERIKCLTDDLELISDNRRK